MTTALFAPRAARELRAAALVVARDNPAAAEPLLDEAVTAARRILAQPMHARVHLRLAPERFRFWSLRPFPYLLVIDTAQAPPVVARFVPQSGICRWCCGRCEAPGGLRALAVERSRATHDRMGRAAREDGLAGYLADS